MINEMNGDKSGATSNGMFAKSMLVRGNHDESISNSGPVWQSKMASLNRSLPAGVTNYVGLNSSSTYLTYSFDYGNSRFIGVDVPGDADLITSSQITFVDQRIANAETSGLTHVFLYWHGPLYCVESTHCSCSTATGNCTPAAIVTMLNKHCISGKSIVSAIFNGHEHILGWTHLSNGSDGTTVRISGLQCPVEQFLTSPSGQSNYNSSIFPARLDYVSTTGGQRGFASIDVNGPAFTVNLYRVGTAVPVWTKTFTKPGEISPSPCTISGDSGNDCKVDEYDYTVWQSHYAPGLNQSGGNTIGDYDRDGYVDGVDYVVWLNHYNP